MKIEKSSANHTILDTGSVITFDSSAELSFGIDMDENFKFDLILKFEKDDKNIKYDVKKAVNGNVITLTCINFDYDLGIGTNFPIELATVNGKKVYINFWVYALGEDSLRKITYTFYQER